MGELQLAVGFGAVDITPPVGLKMCGALEPRISVGITDPLMAKSFVATDGERRLAVVGVDIVGLPRAIIDRAIAAIAARTNLAPDAVIVSCSHTHSGPYTMGPFFLDALDADYLGSLPDRIAASVEQASAALKPATMHLGRSLVYNGPHHRLMLAKDGKAMNSWMSEALNDLAASPQVVGACGPIDPELWVVRFDGPDGQPLGVFFNF